MSTDCSGNELASQRQSTVAWHAKTSRFRTNGEHLQNVYNVAVSELIRQ